MRGRRVLERSPSVPRPYGRSAGALPLLLVSVADPDEAAVALAGGADVLDVKNPREGSLGACEPATLRSIVAVARSRSSVRRAPGPLAAAGRVPVSAALGDAPGLPGTLALAAAGAAACGVDVVKVGVRGTASEIEAIALIRAVARAARSVSPGILVVAGAYAEGARIGALPPEALPDVAGASEADGCLIDTATKDGATLLDHLDPADLRRFVGACRRRRLLCALAGSIGPEDLPILLKIGPDLIGARASLCDRGRRRGALSAGRLAAFRLAMRNGAGRRRLSV